MDLKPLFQPSSMAVIGVSTIQHSHPANVIYTKNHLRYPVRTYGVNPRGGLLDREPLYSSVLEIAEPVDVAVIGVRAQYVPDVMSQCIEKGVKGAIIISGGFSESGNQELQDRVAKMAKEADFPVIGPNCLGVYSPDFTDTFFLPGERIIRPDKGNIGFVSQSGGVLIDQMVKFAGQGIGVSLAVSIGNKACLKETDLIQWFDTDPETQVLAFYIEGFERGEGRQFVQAAQACSKPVVVLKAGKTLKGMEAASSHTASLAGDYQVFSQIMRQHCVAEAENEYELTSFCEALSCYPKGISGRVGIVSLSGGHGVLAADLCLSHGLDIPVPASDTKKRIHKNLSREIKSIASLSNPMDLTGSCVDEDIMTCVRHLSRDKDVDCVLALLLPYSPGISADIGAKLSQVARNEGKPLIAYVPNEDKYKIIIEGFELNRIPVASSVQGAVLMAKALKRCQSC